MSLNTDRTVQVANEQGILARNKVLRQTYILLGMNVLFSAFCAYLGILLNVGHIPWVLALVVVFALPMAIQANRNSGLGIILLFALTGFLGFYISHAIGFYFASGHSDTVVKALAGSAIIFFGLSAYVLTTGKNFTFLGGFLFVGVMVALLAAIGAMLFQMPALSVALSAVFLLIFSGYVLYDTSNIVHGYETNYIMATLQLFLDIFNIFISLLNILSIFGND